MTRLSALVILLAAAGAMTPAVKTGGDARICATLSEVSSSGAGPFLLVFFSTACPSCYDELFEARLAVENAGWPLTVVGICSDPLDELKHFLAKYAWTLPVVHDRRKLLFKKFRVETVPYKAVLIGGETVFRDDPYLEYGRRWEDFRSWLKKRFSL